MITRHPALRRAVIALGLLALAACAPALLLPSQGQLMGALLKPLVGFDPNDVRLFENPVVRNRMVAIMGEEKYATTLKLLQTAREIRKEGALFYAVSHYTPIPEQAAKAGFVWNAESNQLAVALLKGDGAEIFAERIEAVADTAAGEARAAAGERVDAAVASTEARVDATAQGAQDAASARMEAATGGLVKPVWPTEFKDWLDPARALDATVQNTVDAAAHRAGAAAATQIPTP